MSVFPKKVDVDHPCVKIAVTVACQVALVVAKIVLTEVERKYGK